MGSVSIEEIKKAIQAKISRMMELQNLAETYQQLLQLNTAALTEIIQTKEALKEMQKREEKELSGYISLGAGIYVEGIIKKTEKLLVDVGANLAVPMTIEGALEVLERKERDVRNALERIQKLLIDVRNNIDKLNREIELLRRHLEKMRK